MNTFKKFTVMFLTSILIIGTSFLVGCKGPAGPEGIQGEVGPVGPAGDNGSQMYAGPVAPTSDIGNEGDYYLVSVRKLKNRGFGTVK